MKGNFYLSHTGPLRIFTEKEMMLEKATWATPDLGDIFPLLSISIWVKEGVAIYLSRKQLKLRGGMI